jgi:hypothetical protein
MAGDRISQYPIEVLALPTNQQLRATQAVLEPAELPTSTTEFLRVTQAAIEVTELPGLAGQHLRVTQMVIELIQTQPGTGGGGGDLYEA